MIYLNEQNLQITFNFCFDSVLQVLLTAYHSFELFSVVVTNVFGNWDS